MRATSPDFRLKSQHIVRNGLPVRAGRSSNPLFRAEATLTRVVQFIGR